MVTILTIQVNVKLDEGLLKEVERLVKEGRVRTKKEAFERALQLLVKSYKAGELAKRVDGIREGTEKFPSVTALVWSLTKKVTNPNAIVVDSSVIVKWFKKGEEFEQEGLELREDILSSTLDALTSELTRLEVCRALVKAGYSHQKVEETFGTLSEMETFGFVMPVPLATLADEAINLISALNLCVADSIVFASAIVTSSNLLTEDRHL